MVYVVLLSSEKNIGPYVRLKWGLETSFGTFYQKLADTYKFVITQVSYTSQQKKMNTISHVRQNEGLTIGLICTVCKSVSERGCEKSGRIVTFATFLKENYNMSEIRLYPYLSLSLL